MNISGQPTSQTARRLILFGRYPVAGQTKTRLIPLLGLVGAAEFQRELTESCLTTLVAAGLAPVEFCYCGACKTRVRRWLTPFSVDLSVQVSGDLGSRMQAALHRALAQGVRQVVLLGTDVPQMTAEHIRAAFEALAAHDLVLGPSRDGGYWLVGCRRPVDVFRNVAWGTSQVLAQTLAAARTQGLSVAQLEPLNDMDTPEDLALWQPQRDWRRPYLTVVIPALNEAGDIEDTIARIRSRDAQILVVDGGSQDDTALRARRAGAQVLTCGPGRARQQNCGAGQARGRVLLFVHADTRLPADYISQIFEVLMDSRTVLGAFRFKTDFDHWSMRLIEKTVHIRSMLFHLPYGDQALFMRRRQFAQVGGFPSTPVAEDLFLVRRMARLGRIGHAPGAAITSGRLWRRAGVWRTTLINYLIAAGCMLGVNPDRLALMYKWLRK